ncbi:hypothetical protein K435DRAFT_469823 [Dendrothele bispora CBS 962.96]|uniref:Uncharacterized protein n=1 Tax=Dendrothele bispora (strain CBS 962.96) TaxID=1314807 RepID=A0A4S8L085_DENBC|nr:hypothetical protein K435DRAFT_469823 [Dendrothele bispora CBS 962.96]
MLKRLSIISFLHPQLTTPLKALHVPRKNLAPLSLSLLIFNLMLTLHLISRPANPLELRPQPNCIKLKTQHLALPHISTVPQALILLYTPQDRYREEGVRLGTNNNASAYGGSKLFYLPLRSSI